MSSFTLPPLNGCAVKAQAMRAQSASARSLGLDTSVSRGNVAATWGGLDHADYSESPAADAHQGGLPPLREREAAAVAVVENPSAFDVEVLRHKQLALERHLAVSAFMRHERNERSVVIGREYERRYAIFWKYENASAKVRRSSDVENAARLTEEKRKYSETVRLFTAWGVLVNDEMLDRELLHREEGKDRDFIISLQNLEMLQADANRLSDAEVDAHYLYEEASAVRQLEMANALTAYRPPKEFAPKEPLQLVSSTIITGKPDDLAISSAIARRQYLMDYAVNEEEFVARQRIRYGEMLGRLPMNAILSVLSLVDDEEQERAAIAETFLWGCCQARLAAVIRIQCWWRLTRAQSWSVRRKEDIRSRIGAKRLNRTADDLRFLIDKMNSSSATQVEKTAEDYERELQALDSAATRLHGLATDYYLFTLSERIQTFVQSEKHVFALQLSRPSRDASPEDLSSAAANWAHIRKRPDVPHRLPLRVGLPYSTWRKSRWIPGSLHHCHSVAAIEHDEAVERDAIEHAESRNISGVETLVLAANAGPDTLESVELAVEDFLREEHNARLELEDKEEEAASTFRVWFCQIQAKTARLLQPFNILRQEEEEQRAALCNAYMSEYDELMCGEWRWEQLRAYRRQLAMPYKSKRAWGLAVHSGVGRKFVSLDSAARVVTRFMHRMMRVQVEEVRRRPPPQPKELSLIAVRRVLLTQLYKLHKAQAKARRASMKVQAKTTAATANLSEEEIIEKKSRIAALLFNGWLDLEASQPRDQRYREVLQRFHCAHTEFFRSMNYLLLLYREGRNAIEDDEVVARRYMQDNRSYRATVIHVLEHRERRRRMFLDAEEEDARDDIIVDLRFAHKAIKWGVAADTLIAKNHNNNNSKQTTQQKEERVLPVGIPLALRRVAPSTAPRPVGEYTRALPNKKSAAAALPIRAMTDMERFFAREDVCRARIESGFNNAMRELLLDHSVFLRSLIVEEEARERYEECRCVDREYTRNPPIAQMVCLVADERQGRRELEQETAMSYSAPLIRAHYMLSLETLWPQFRFGHLSMTAEADYMDRRLLTLLTQRVGHVGAKLNDLVELESASRSRVAYAEEITRELRFVSKRLIL